MPIIGLNIRNICIVLSKFKKYSKTVFKFILLNTSSISTIGRIYFLFYFIFITNFNFLSFLKIFFSLTYT